MDGGCRVARSWGNLRKSCLNRTLAGTWFLAHGLKDADRLSFVRRQRSSASHTWEFARAVLAAVSRESCNLFVHPEGRNYVYETDNKASDQLTFHG